MYGTLKSVSILWHHRNCHCISVISIITHVLLHSSTPINFLAYDAQLYCTAAVSASRLFSMQHNHIKTSLPHKSQWYWIIGDYHHSQRRMHINQWQSYDISMLPVFFLLLMRISINYILFRPHWRTSWSQFCTEKPYKLQLSQFIKWLLHTSVLAIKQKWQIWTGKFAEDRSVWNLQQLIRKERCSCRLTQTPPCC